MYEDEENQLTRNGKAGEQQHPSVNLSKTSLTFLSFLAALILWTSASEGTLDWNCFELCLLLFHPCVLLFMYYHLKLHAFVPLDSAICVFAAGFLPGTVLALSWEHVSFHVLTQLFGDTSSSLLMGFVFLFLVSYGTTALVEELFKAWTVTVMSKSMVPLPTLTPRALALAAMILTTSGSAGFACLENLIYFGIPCKLIGVCSPMRPHVSVQTLMFRTLVPATLHILCGVMTGVNLSRRRQRTKTSLPFIFIIILPSVLCHGTYNLFVHYVTSILSQWIIGVAGLCLTTAVLACCIRQLRRDLRDRSYDVPSITSSRQVRIGDLHDVLEPVVHVVHV